MSSGDQDTIKFALDFYKRHVPQAFVWQHFLGHGLWGTYPRDVQDRAHAAVASGAATAPGPGGAQLHLHALRERGGGEERVLRCALQTTFLCPDSDGWAATSRAGVDPTEAWVLLGSGVLALAAPDAHALQLLCDEAVVDPSLWSPPCKSVDCRGSAAGDRAKAYERASRAFFESLFSAPADLVPDLAGVRATPSSEPERQGRGARGGAAESRFTDGLASPSDTTGVSRFYPADYESPIGTLDFCCALPDNPLGLGYPMPVIAQMCVDAVSKMFELGRRGEPLSPVHVLPIYVYTCELAESDDQIYGAMNRAMRESDAEALAFWRPLIWLLDRALQVRPLARRLTSIRQTFALHLAASGRGGGGSRGPIPKGGGGAGLQERGNDTSGSIGRSGRQNAATRRNMRRDERVTVQGPVKEQQRDGLSHGGGGTPPSTDPKVVARNNALCRRLLF